MAAIPQRACVCYDSLMPATFDNMGITFQYPDNWQLDEEELRAGQSAITPIPRRATKKQARIRIARLRFIEMLNTVCTGIGSYIRQGLFIRRSIKG